MTERAAVERLALRPKEVAEALGISERTLREWMRNEGLPFARVGRLVVIPRTELLSWLAARVEATCGADGIAGKILAEIGLEEFA